jgi:hypothetical protein
MALDQIRAGSNSDIAYFTATFNHRVLAICSLLLDADQEAFARQLYKSGRARLVFLEKVDAGLAADPKTICTSKDIGFTAALAAAHLEGATQIANLSPQTHFSGVEYEDDFLFFHFMHRMLCDPDDRDELQALLDRWEIVLAGDDSGYWDACNGLLADDDADFAEGLESLITFRQTQLRNYRDEVTCDEELFAAEGKVFIEGLAVLRLAEIKGFEMQDEYELMPQLARVPLDAGVPDPDSWQEAEETDDSDDGGEDE